MDMDYERLVVDHLNASGIGAKAYPDVPYDRPESFVTVLRTGGGHDNIVMEHPMFACDCWGATRPGAEALARSVRDAAMEMPAALDNVFGCNVTAFYRNPDPDSGAPRYTVSFELDVCE